MSVLAELSIVPMDKGDSFSTYVAKALTVIKNSGLTYQLGPMGTCIEGEWNEVMAVITKCFETLKADSRRVSVSIKIDYRADRSGAIMAKPAAVVAKMGK